MITKLVPIIFFQPGGVAYVIGNLQSNDPWPLLTKGLAVRSATKSATVKLVKTILFILIAANR